MLDRATRMFLGELFVFLCFVLSWFICLAYSHVLLDWVTTNLSVWIWGPLAVICVFLSLGGVLALASVWGRKDHRR